MKGRAHQNGIDRLHFVLPILRAIGFLYQYLLIFLMDSFLFLRPNYASFRLKRLFVIMSIRKMGIVNITQTAVRQSVEA